MWLRGVKVAVMIDPAIQLALRRAAATFGGFAQLGRQIGISQQAVSGWHSRGTIPAKRVLEIERLTGVSRHQLRPDLYPVETAE